MTNGPSTERLMYFVHKNVFLSTPKSQIFVSANCNEYSGYYNEQCNETLIITTKVSLWTFRSNQ